MGLHEPYRALIASCVSRLRTQPCVQLRQHLDDTNKQATGSAVELDGYDAASEQEVDDGGAFGGATPRHAIEAGLVGAREAAGSLSQIQNDRYTRALELIAQH